MRNYAPRGATISRDEYEALATAYPIRGRQSIRDAVKAASIDVIHDHEDVAAAAPASIREKLASFWKQGLGVAEGGEKMAKIATGVAEAVPKLVNSIHTAATSLS